MRENRVRAIWRGGGGGVNAWLTIASGFAAEVMANEPFDSVTIDLQHGMVDFQGAVAMLQAISANAPTPLARVPWNDPGQIMKLLDAGAYGIICPMINNRAECERFVRACRYPPLGYRSFGPARGVLYGGADYGRMANETVLTFAMIETREALDNLDAIMSVDGLDAIYIGPNDLALALGHEASPVAVEPDVKEAVQAILAAAKRNGVVAGIHCPSGAVSRQHLDMGFQFVTINNDARLLAAAARAEIARARGQNV